jgi:hypothetical protein
MKTYFNYSSLCKIIFTLFFLLLINVAEAKCTIEGKAKYRKDYGWSQYYSVEISFLSGHELNQATKTYDYDSYSVYAVIFWGEGEATVIKVSCTTLCGLEVKPDCIKNHLGNLEGEDGQGIGWQICLSGFCF